jgi:hypothetical protein
VPSKSTAWRPKGHPYKALLNYKGKRHTLGYFETWEEARLAEVEFQLELLKDEAESLKRRAESA